MPRGQYDRRAIQAQGERPEVEKPVEQALSNRATELRRERRRRDDGDLDRMGRMALSIPPEVRERLGREGKTARWVRDASGRQAEMHRDDWDVTPNVDPVAEGRDSEGKLVLMEKYKDWYEADQQKKRGVLDQRDDHMLKGIVSGPDGSGQSVGYVPTGNNISRKAGL
jgi:hypothetical protein